MTLMIYILLLLVVSAFGAYTISFQGATHYWGRRIAGQESIESILEQVDESDAAEWDKAKKSASIQFSSTYDRGLQDIIIPLSQQIRIIVFVVLVIALPIAGGYVFAWYVGAITFLSTFVFVPLFRRLMPRQESDYFKKRILTSLEARAHKFYGKRNEWQGRVLIYVSDLLKKAERDSAINKG